MKKNVNWLGLLRACLELVYLRHIYRTGTVTYHGGIRDHTFIRHKRTCFHSSGHFVNMLRLLTCVPVLLPQQGTSRNLQISNYSQTQSERRQSICSVNTINIYVENRWRTKTLSYSISYNQTPKTLKRRQFWLLWHCTNAPTIYMENVVSYTTSNSTNYKIVFNWNVGSYIT